jgi:aspartate racemase
VRTVGIIGGIGPQSTIEYYRLLIAAWRQQKGDGAAPSIVINSIDLAKMLELMANDRNAAVEYLVAEVNRLERAGADFGVLAANTPHVLFEEIQRRSAIPLISIVEATCDAARALRLKKVALFGTRFTMQGRFYPDVFARAGIALVVPDEEEQLWIHEKYMAELINGIILPETRQRLLAIVDRMIERHGIDGLILGGTELSLILRDAAYHDIPLLDTTTIHVARIVSELLKDR